MEQFNYNGKTYTAKSELVDTDYGPETKVGIYDSEGKRIATFQEAMSVKGIIRMFMDEMEDSNL